MTELLALDSVTKSFGRGRVLSSATLMLAPGQVHVLMGRNGSGKTTLLRIAVGLERADQGVVRYKGRWIERPRLDRLARQGLFYLPQRGLLVRSWTVRAHLRRTGSSEIDAIVRALDLSHLLGSPAGELSGGQRRRVELGVALARNPGCLLADEPFRGLAPKDVGRVSDHLRELADGGCGVLVTGHETRDVLSIADAVTWLENGSTRYLGPPEAAKAVDAFRQRYLGLT